MLQPLVIAHHLIWTGYGWWLPNDPRGSGSRAVASDILTQLGTLHFGRKRIQPPRAEVRQFYEGAAPLLKHALLTMDSDACGVIARAFHETVNRERYTCYACAIMPDHVHILIRKHKHSAEEMIANLQPASREKLIQVGHRPIDHPVWTGGGGWKVFLDHPEEVRRTIRYIVKNPLELNLPEQRWEFVIPYDGWPLHPGHSPQSPYAKRLREAGRYP
jgi:REP element-mobilizing transposase RayT